MGLNRKTMNILNILLTCIGLAGCSVNGGSVDVVVENSGTSDRKGEMVEISMSDIGSKLGMSSGSVSVTDGTGSPVPCQITYDGYLIFPADVKAGSSAVYSVSCSEISSDKDTFTAVSSDTITCGRIYPERLDDLAWENDKAAYRTYGPAFQKRGDKGFGYDILTKSVAEPVVEERYRMELDTVAASRMRALRKEGRHSEADSIYRSISYHVDHGNGMDCYNVGPTLGGGTTAFMVDSAIVYPYCYKECEVLDNGPLRFTAKLVYNPMVIGCDSNVVETRIITLDKGSYLNRTDVSYSGLGDSTAKTLVTGIVLHSQNPDGYFTDSENNFMAYADSTNNPKAGNGVIYVGAVFHKPVSDMGVQMFENAKSDAIGHVLGYSEYKAGSTYRYYWGSGWSKGDMPDADTWNIYLKGYSYNLAHPLKVSIK